MCQQQYSIAEQVILFGALHWLRIQFLNFDGRFLKELVKLQKPTKVRTNAKPGFSFSSNVVGDRIVSFR